MEDKQLIRLKDVLASLAFGTILTGIINFSTITRYLFQDTFENTTDINHQIAERTEVLFTFVNSLSFSSTVITMVLWSIVGAIVYCVLQLFFSNTKEIVEDIDVSIRYVHPKNFDQLKFWLSALWYLVYPAIFLAILFCWLLFSILILMPFSSVTFLLGLYTADGPLHTITLLILSVGVTTFMILGFVVLYKVTKGLSRVIR